MPNYYGSNEVQSKVCAQLQSDRFMFLTDSQEVKAVVENIGVPQEYQSDVTAAIVEVLDGDYGEVWLSEDSAPYELSADYHNLAWYLV